MITVVMYYENRKIEKKLHKKSLHINFYSFLQNLHNAKNTLNIHVQQYLFACRVV